MRAERECASSSLNTGTVFCKTMGPWSRCSSTKWTVQPETFTPYSAACFCASRPEMPGAAKDEYSECDWERRAQIPARAAACIRPGTPGQPAHLSEQPPLRHRVLREPDAEVVAA